MHGEVSLLGQDPNKNKRDRFSSVFRLLTEKANKQKQDRSGFDFSNFSFYLAYEGTQGLYLEFLTEE